MLTRLVSSDCLFALLVLAAVLQSGNCSLRAVKGFRRSKSLGLSRTIPVQSTAGFSPRPVAEVEAELKLRRRAAGNNPQIDGAFQFQDGYPTALIQYSGGYSSVIFVLTYRVSNSRITNSNLYRSDDYGSSFTKINNLLNGGENVVLYPRIFVSDYNYNMLFFTDASQSRLYYTLDKGQRFNAIDITSFTLNPATLNYHPDENGWIMARDSSNSLYVTRDYGQSWNKVDNSVTFSQWGDSDWDEHPFRIYYTTADPNDSDLSSNLYISDTPFTSHRPFDPDFGSHDAFLMYGPYIFAQRTDQGKINLYVSHLRGPFQLAKIPTPYNHRNYLVSNIVELQAMLIIEHEGGFYNMYLSDTTGVYYSLSLRDIVVERGYLLDLEVINGVNGTLIANQYVRIDPSQTSAPLRTIISFNNGAQWEPLRPPDSDVTGAPINCEPPLCSLNLHMTSTSYARLGVFSTSSAPGLIIAHGNANETLLNHDPDLYISRDAGIHWEQTLKSSWGVGVADHGGLLVAAKDYHQRDSSNSILYSCNEGHSWNTFNFSGTDVMIYGVVTEPGEHTTVMSLYGQTTSLPRQWIVFTINFTNIFDRVCRDTDYEQWEPWDDRSWTDCVLGVTVTIERRKAQVCCLNGRTYDRKISVDICECNFEDFECDYGFERDEQLCVRDPDVTLSNPCANGEKTYTASTGYRKIAGDLCQKGDEALFAPYTASCCDNSTLPPTLNPRTSASTSASTSSSGGTSTTKTLMSSSLSPSSPQKGGSSSSTSGALIGTGVVIGLLVLASVVIVIILVLVALKYSSLRQRYTRLIMAGEETTTQRFTFRSDRDRSMESLTFENEDREDYEPLIP